MTNKKQLKILMVKPLVDCAPHIRKILKENQPYFLYNNYQEKDDWIECNGKSLSIDFFAPKEENKPLVSVSAIVGKNGGGKSSLVELIIRIINNFAKAYDFLGDSASLIYIKGINAEFYFSVREKKETIYKITMRSTQKDESIILYKESEKIWDISFDVKDGVLADSRDLGGYVNDQYKLDFIADFFYTIVANYSLYAYNTRDYRQEKNNSNTHWLDHVFHKNDGYQVPLVLFPMRTEGNININIEDDLSQQRLLSLFINADSSPDSFRNISHRQHASMLALKDPGYSKLHQRTILDYFGKVENETVFDFSISDFKYAKEDIQQVEIKLNKFITEKYNQDSLNILQVQRIELVNYIFNKWKTHPQYKSIFKHLELDFEYDFKAFERNAVHYVIYKTISILDKYPDYQGSLHDYNNVDLFSQNRVQLGDANRKVDKAFDKLIDDIENEQTHVTLKLRQTLNFLKGDVHLYHTLGKKLQTKNKYVEENISRHIDGKVLIVSLDALHNNQSNSHILVPLDRLPPPIFRSEVYMEQTNEKSYSPIGSLSSGEKQMLYTISSVIYHIQNLDSVSDNSTKYNHVNLFFEEIELYFHPEYQRKFIKYLLDNIRRVHIPTIESINICFVTHSPFVLSDIPKDNIVFLKDGMPTFEMQENTFGANIHSLLKNGFFMETVPIGDFAHEKINSLFGKLNSGNFTTDEFESMYADICLVGEPYIRGQLLSLYNSYKLPTTERRREQVLEQQLHNLQQELTELKNSLKK